MLSALPNPANEVRHDNWCELENGHQGAHHTLGQASLEETWWIRWDDGGNRRELVTLPRCTAQQTGEDPEPCTLPQGTPEHTVSNTTRSNNKRVNDRTHTALRTPVVERWSAAFGVGTAVGKEMAASGGGGEA
jgi:hypothetical protein